MYEKVFTCNTAPHIFDDADEAQCEYMAPAGNPSY
jgi:hypothetical protein